jgi:hypothetical protein
MALAVHALTNLLQLRRQIPPMKGIKAPCLFLYLMQGKKDSVLLQNPVEVEGTLAIGRKSV